MTMPNERPTPWGRWSRQNRFLRASVLWLYDYVPGWMQDRLEAWLYPGWLCIRFRGHDEN